jgi:hypothetical protein
MINETLSSIAEISITLAGFSGLLAAFRSSKSSVREELRRITSIFVFCFAVIVASFLPAIVETFSPGSDLNWQLSVFLISLVAIFSPINTILMVRTGQIRLQFPVGSLSMMAVLFTVGLMQIGALVGIIPGAPQGYLLVGVLWLVTHAGYLFVTTLFWAQVDEDGI